jgi:hypothetical protein
MKFSPRFENYTPFPANIYPRLFVSSEIAGQDVVIALAYIFRHHRGVSGEKIIFVLRPFVGNLQGRKPAIEQAEVATQPRKLYDASIHMPGELLRRECGQPGVLPRIYPESRAKLLGIAIADGVRIAANFAV